LQAQVEEARKKADGLQAQVEEARKNGLRLAKEIGLQAAYQACEGGDKDGAKALLQVVPADSRGWEWRHVQKLCTPQGLPPVIRVKLPANKESFNLAAFTPDGTRMVTDTLLV